MSFTNTQSQGGVRPIDIKREFCDDLNGKQAAGKTPLYALFRRDVFDFNSP